VRGEERRLKVKWRGGRRLEGKLRGGEKAREQGEGRRGG
jgi:hypothetical protein